MTTPPTPFYDSPTGARHDREQNAAQPLADASKMFELSVFVGNIVDPWSCLEVASRHPQWLAWAQPSRHACWLAWGATDRYESFFRGPQAQRYSCGQEQVDGQRQEAAEAPFWVGGNAFFRDQKAFRGAWQGWPRSAGWTPRVVLLRRRRGGCLLLLRGRDAAALEHHLARVKQQLLTACGGSPPQPLPASVGGATGATAAVLAPPGDAAQHRYRTLVARAAHATTLPPLRKVVVARAHDWRAPAGSHFDALASVRALRQQQPNATSFALSLCGGGEVDGAVFVGATPERLLKLRGTALRTHALAATAHAGGGNLKSPKMVHEHQLVVDGLRRDLQPLCQRLRVAPPTRLRAGTLVHLASDIEGHLKPNITLQQLVQTLHPSAALGGFPRAQALAWLRQHERLERGWYGGPVGYLDGDGGGEVVVAIRSALLRHRRARAYVGAGIVADSSPHEEWQETEAKLATIANALCLQPQPASAAASAPPQFAP
ncbi:MAG TPA: isochorismate synthase [Sorangium sp.]|nr:isochorismate synthase [Sorangium sp.]